MSAPAVFLDKDGTLIEDVPYNVDPDRICLTTGTVESLQLLARAGYRLIVVTNQGGVARGYFPEEALGGVEQRLRGLLAVAGVRLAGFYYCPHHPNGRIERYAIACSCRKPHPGMLLRASRDHDIDLQRSWMVGDILHDVEAGRRAGCRAVLLDVGHETEWEWSVDRTPHFTARTMLEAAQFIIAPSMPARVSHSAPPVGTRGGRR